jgi:hypothetical protein
MTTGIAPIDGIIAGIGIAVDVDALEDRVPAVGREEPAEDRVVISGMEILEAGLGIEALADIGLAAAGGLAEDR